jgi:predicted dehydrogenase
VNHFVECITNKETPVPSFEEAFKTERVLDAVVRSSQKGKAVDVET